MIDTINSVIGNAHQTPVIAPIHDNKNAVGIITKNPLNKEILWAGSGCSTDVKYIDIMILNPANGQAKKYNFNPCEAMMRKV